jgi:indolepyruvate ferredoxin oxidoreductase, beta subunit
MSAAATNIFLIGVGGQGIGLLSETVLRAAARAELPVRGVDTHGLAQRGGSVSSHVRIGSDAHSPLIGAGEADLVIALERYEALRGLTEYARSGGALVYYDTEWQPLAVRLGQSPCVESGHVASCCADRNIRCFRVLEPELPDARMQNVAVLATMARNALVPGVTADHYRWALSALMQGAALEANLALFDRMQAEAIPVEGNSL